MSGGFRSSEVIAGEQRRGPSAVPFRKDTHVWLLILILLALLLFGGGAYFLTSNLLVVIVVVLVVMALAGYGGRSRWR
jgi:hypothetical protein